MSRKGFTIVELITSTAIVGIISTMAINQYSVIKEKAYRTTILSHLRNAYTSIQSKAADNLSEPGRLAGSEYRAVAEYYPDGWTSADQYNQQPVDPVYSNISANPDIILPGYRKQSQIYLRAYVLRTRENNGSISEFIEILSGHCGIRPTEDTIELRAYVVINGDLSEYPLYVDADLYCLPQDD